MCVGRNWLTVAVTVHRVCWTELTGMQCAYGAQTGSSRQSSFLYCICVPSVTSPVANNKCHITDIHIVSDLNIQQKSCYITRNWINTTLITPNWITEVYFSRVLYAILHLTFPNLCYHNSVCALFVLCVGIKILKSKIRIKHT